MNSSTYDVSISELDSAAPELKPDEIGSFSVDIDLKFVNSKQYLKYFIKPSDPENVDFDLRKGFEKSKDLMKAHGNTFHILQWIKENMEKLSSDGKLKTDFVCRRGLLVKIMTTPYEKEAWTLAVILFNGTYYLEEVVSEERKSHEKHPKDDMASCLGWKFEQYLTADCEDGKPNPDEPYNNCEAFYTVVKTQLNDHSLVFSGEVDAINTNGNYMEFKTNKEFGHNGHVFSFKRYKTKKWWAQSHLIGVKEIVCGFKDENDVVKRLEFYKTEHLPKKSSDIKDPWKPDVCTNFLNQFLTFIKSSITTDDHRIAHTLQLAPKKELDRVKCSLLKSDSENNFLHKHHQWYISDETALNQKDFYRFLF